MQIDDYQSVTRLVKHVEVTEENMADVAEWCGGQIKGQPAGGGVDGPPYFIQVPVHNPVNKKQGQARVGDHVLFEPTRETFKVYTQKAFENNFTLVFQEGALTGEKVTNVFEENSEQHVNVFEGEGSPDLQYEEDKKVIEARGINYRDVISGEYVTKEYALANPDTTVKETDWVDPPSHNPFEAPAAGQAAEDESGKEETDEGRDE